MLAWGVWESNVPAGDRVCVTRRATGPACIAFGESRTEEDVLPPSKTAHTSNELHCGWNDVSIRNALSSGRFPLACLLSVSLSLSLSLFLSRSLSLSFLLSFPTLSPSAPQLLPLAQHSGQVNTTPSRKRSGRRTEEGQRRKGRRNREKREGNMVE